MKAFNKITFKDEGEIDGEPFGPIVLSAEDGEEQRLERWMTLGQARALAAKAGLELNEF